MSMTVDETTPLTEEERRYLLERGQVDKVAALDAKFADWESDEDDEDAEDYADWKKEQLVAELKRRELDPSGKVEELRARLIEDDQADEGDED